MSDADDLIRKFEARQAARVGGQDPAPEDPGDTPPPEAKGPGILHVPADVLRGITILEHPNQEWSFVAHGSTSTSMDMAELGFRLIVGTLTEETAAKVIKQFMEMQRALMAKAMLNRGQQP